MTRIASPSRGRSALLALTLAVSVAAVNSAFSQDMQQPATVKFPNGPVVILGASYAKGWQPRAENLQFVNKGVEGQQTFELLERFDRDVVASSPRAVIVWGFINDIFRAPEGRLPQSIERARQSLVGIVGRARAAGIEPILATEVTIRPRDNTWSEVFASWVGWLRGKEAYQDGINRHVLETNQWLRDLARREGLLLLDLQPAVSGELDRRRKEYATPDGSHISPEGYAALTAYAAPVLQNHFAQTTR